ncbi:MAG: histidine kinase [Clostridiales bacterium]|nr:histidine kinase [Clostridiales bacterium]
MSKYLDLKKSNCANCYKCVRYCSVKSIRFSGNQAHIIDDECILCGQCFVVCPQNAKVIVSEQEKVRVYLQDTQPVIASVAPSFVANYDGVGIEGLKEALLKLGFADVEETAIGATIVKKEYERILREEKPKVLISSACPSINLLIQKHFPSVLPYLATVLSPMQAHCQDIKRRNPMARTVFIGPCIAKKEEGDHSHLVDAVLTFKELSDWLAAEGIEIPKTADTKEGSKARLFPTTAGILKTMAKEEDYTYLALDGTENCIAALKDIESGKVENCFLELSACAGSCINGPVMEKYHGSFLQNYLQVTKYAGTEDYPVQQPDMEELKKDFEVLPRAAHMPSEYEILEILRQMGKRTKEDELNCATCGYDTCREKAIAVYQGKAEISMCLPFLKDKAESFSDTLVKHAPNAYLILNENLEVQQLNHAALRLLNLRAASDILGEQVIRILDPKYFMSVLTTGKDIHNQKIYLAEYKKYVEQTIVHDKSYRVLLCIMRDITEQELEREKRDKVSQQTIEVADRVVDNQMRIVQEIASLLGETAAETKIALTKLKESIADE